MSPARKSTTRKTAIRKGPASRAGTVARPGRAPSRPPVAVVGDSATAAAGSLVRGWDELATGNRQQLEALLQVSAAILRGLETLGRAWAVLGEGMLRDGQDAAQALSGAQSVQELVSVHADLTRRLLDRALAESLLLTELSASMASASTAPVRAAIDTAFAGVAPAASWRRAT